MKNLSVAVIAAIGLSFAMSSANATNGALDDDAIIDIFAEALRHAEPIEAEIMFETMTDEHAFTVGDRIMFLENDDRIGSFGVIAALQEEQIWVRLDDHSDPIRIDLSQGAIQTQVTPAIGYAIRLLFTVEVFDLLLRAWDHIVENWDFYRQRISTVSNITWISSCDLVSIVRIWEDHEVILHCLDLPTALRSESDAEER